MAKETVVLVVPTKVPTPKKATEGSLGVDLYTAETVRIPANETVLVKLYAKTKGASLLFARSSIWKLGVVIANGVGVIDKDYRGQLCIPLTNFRNVAVNIDEMTRVAQIIPADSLGGEGVIDVVQDDESFEKWDEMHPTERGSGGFGSTGVGAEPVVKNKIAKMEQETVDNVDNDNDTNDNTNDDRESNEESEEE